MVLNQAYLFLIFIINGIIIGLLFDFFRISRRVISTNDMATYLEDVLFWILAGAIMLYSIFVFNNGELRLFMFLGVLLGAFTYMIFISSHMIAISVKIIMLLKKVLGILIIPLKVVYKAIQKIFFKPVHFLFINIRKNISNFGTQFYKNIKNSKKDKNIVRN